MAGVRGLGRIRQAKAGEGGLVANGTGGRKEGEVASGWWGEQREGEQLVAGGERRGRVEWRVERRAGSAGGQMSAGFLFFLMGDLKSKI